MHNHNNKVTGKKMANILKKKGIKISNRVPSTANPQAESNLPPMADLQKSAITFLKKLPDVKEVNVTKMALLDPEKGTWEAEAEVYIPNATIKTLGLPIQKDVLDCEYYLLRLDGKLNIIAYGLKDSVEG